MNVLDCGHPAGGAGPAWDDAHDCVVQAVREQLPFIVQWERSGIDSRVAGALIGWVSDTGWPYEWFSYDGDPSGGGGEDMPVTSSESCEDVVDLGEACSGLQLCVGCVGAIPASRCDAD